MREYSSCEIQSISSNFRNVARRLSRTDHSQCEANLKRFMALLQTEELIADFIAKNNTVVYDVPSVMKQRYWLDPFEVSPIQNEEISFSVQIFSINQILFNVLLSILYSCATSVRGISLDANNLNACSYVSLS